MGRAVTLTLSGPLRKTDYTRRLEARAFYAYGGEFLKVATKSGSGLVRAYLLGHALELLLKAYLLNAGQTPTQLRESFGHNLAGLLSEAKKNGLDRLVRISPQLEADVNAFSPVYASKRLEYFSSLDLLSPWRLPDQRRMTRFVRVFAKKLDVHLPVP